MNEKRRGEIRSAFDKPESLKAFNETHRTSYSIKKLPREFRPRLTKALRLKLTKKQINAKTLRQQKKQANFPQRRFAVTA